jgi:gamma-glutamyltranspeptidase
MFVQKEKEFPSEIIDYLSAIGHDIMNFVGLGSAVTAVQRKNECITANSDYRRDGCVAGF